jgi:hypothetical protein
MSYPAIYRAKATGRSGSILDVFVPQIYGDVPIKVNDFVGAPPESLGMGWVMFQGGDPAFPVWISERGGGIGGADEVHVGPSDPGPGYEVWYDPDATGTGSGGGGTGADEVWIGPGTPGDAAIELWYDTDAAVIPVPWISATLLNSWTNFGGIQPPAQYRLVGDLVQVRGRVRNGTNGQPIFILPVGFRAPWYMSFPVTMKMDATTIVVGVVDIYQNGEVRQVFPSSPTEVWLNFPPFSVTT